MADEETGGSHSRVGQTLLQVDRVEGEHVVLARGGADFLELPAVLLPDGLRSGEILRLSVRHDRDTAVLHFERDRDATAQAFERHRGLLEELREGDRGGET